MSNYNITYYVPLDLTPAYLNDWSLRGAHVDIPFFAGREEIVEKYIPEEHEILRSILLAEKPPFIYVNKGKTTKTIPEAAEHLGLSVKRISKTIVASNERCETYLLTVLGTGLIQMFRGLKIKETKETIDGLKQVSPDLIEKLTGMSPGWCGPFPLNEGYLNRTQNILFRERYSRITDLTDIPISPTESVLMPANRTYRILKERYPNKVFRFSDN